MDFVFVISHAPNPRMNKRLQVAKETGDTALIFWDRVTVKIWDVFHSDIKNIKISVRANYTNPLKRIFPTIKFCFRALREIKKLNPKCLYVANVDMLFIANLYTIMSRNKPEIIYEVADLNKLIVDKQKYLTKRIARSFLIYLERWLCKKINTLVVTSEKFYENYYSKFVPESKLEFIPNMPNLDVFKNFRIKKSGKFTIGFIGAIRYKEQMKMLIDAAEQCNINVLFAGAALDNEIEEISKNKEFVEYTGKYKYETEVADLYGKVDCIYAVYDSDANNVKYALPNKLYESIYCGLPIIVAKGTYLADLVQSMGVGVAVSHKDVKELISVLQKMVMDVEYYNSFVTACDIHKEKVNVNNYNKKLRKRLIKVLN